MSISPRRRRRILREHQLRQNGYTLEQIAEKVNVSTATVHADLRLLETNWSEVAGGTRNDLLLQQINRVNRRIGHLLNTGVVGLELCVTFDEALRARALHAQELNASFRELRLLLKELPGETPAGGEVVELELDDFPDHELADPERPRKNLKEPETVRPATPRKAQAIVAATASEKRSSENLKPTPPPAPIATLPKNTGRNKPCPCGSGKKRKLCHPQHARSQTLSPELESEAIRLTRRVQEAEQNNDPLAQINALSELAELTGLYGK